MQKLLNAVPECSEWGRVYILDFMAANMLSSSSITPAYAEEII